METVLLIKVADIDLSTLLSSVTEQGWEMSDSEAGLSWTQSELMGEALIVDKWEHATRVSMETNCQMRSAAECCFLQRRLRLCDFE